MQAISTVNIMYLDPAFEYIGFSMHSIYWNLCRDEGIMNYYDTNQLVIL